MTYQDGEGWTRCVDLGKHVKFAVIDNIRLKDGKYVEHWASADMMGLMQQLKA